MTVLSAALKRVKISVFVHLYVEFVCLCTVKLDNYIYNMYVVIFQAIMALYLTNIYMLFSESFLLLVML